jgi:hypothetical protein
MSDAPHDPSHDPQRDPQRDPTPVPLAVLNCSTLLWVATAVSAVLLTTVGLLALRAGGPRPPALIVTALAGLALAVLLLDLPRRTEVHERGLARVCLLRTEHVGWERVIAIERQRRLIGGRGSGGLVARGRRGRWLLSTPAEPPHVHERLRAALAQHAPHVRLVADPPATTTDAH